MRRGNLRSGVLWTTVGVFLLLLLFSMTQASGQRQRDVLTDRQTEDLREHADQPVEKLKLYLGYIEQRTAGIHRLAVERSAPDTGAEIHNLYDQFTDLCDELQDNLDAYMGQHQDLRKALNLITEKSEQWTSVLSEPRAREEYDFARKDALDACRTLHDSAAQALAEQEKYFAAHKHEKGGGE